MHCALLFFYGGEVYRAYLVTEERHCTLHATNYH